MKDDKSIPQVSVDNPDNKSFEVKFIDVWRFLPPYWKIGTGGRMNYMRIEPVNAIKVMAKMTPQEFYVLEILLKSLLKTKWVFDPKQKKEVPVQYTSCYVSYKASTLDKNQKAKFKEGAKRLVKKGLLAREKREHFMINPAFIIPSEYPTEENDWIMLLGSESEYTATTAEEMMEDNGIKSA